MDKISRIAAMVAASNSSMLEGDSDQVEKSLRAESRIMHHTIQRFKDSSERVLDFASDAENGMKKYGEVTSDVMKKIQNEVEFMRRFGKILGNIIIECEKAAKKSFLQAKSAAQSIDEIVSNIPIPKQQNSIKEIHDTVSAIKESMAFLKKAMDGLSEITDKYSPS